MKKLHLLLAALLLALLTACGATADPKPAEKEPVTEQANEKEAAFPVTIKDGVGKDVNLEQKPEKIVSLIPSNTEIVYALGEGETIVGVTDVDNYPEEVADKEIVSTFMELNIEKIISLEPDVVLAHASTASYWEAGLQQLEDSGVTVLVVNDAQSFDGVYESIEMIGKATGKIEEADTLIEDMKGKLAELKKQAESISDEDQKSVFVEISPAPEIYATGKNTFINEMLELIHAKNAVEEEGWPQMNEEAIIALNPDVIVLTYGYVENAVDQVLERAGWEDVTAVKEKQVYEVNEDLVSRSGPRVVEGVEELAKAIYPDVFGK
ncbi:ABC transporter substrate-binding protein [Bacillus sp. FJAT-50079]|uniref:ABC transporter substrate-binding protein n=1 Tax=Bacillus sp. FJAT-50079 TaxID=2833577 RepID=UPI001BC97434|nr:ABC transporter substrate-binding protein [Bacillus sp. FJAT-50079]MBS4206828.1 ABC transporter substrate-binding protein [Bacillus sp. FJAT-50079]